MRRDSRLHLLALRYHEQSRKHATARSWNAQTLVALLMVPMALMLSVPLTHARDIKVGPNVNLTSNVPREVVEPAIAVDPRNPSIIVGGAMSFNIATPDAPWPVYFWSTDGGVTWSSRLLPGFAGDNSPEGLASPLRSFAGGGDSEVAFDRSGNLYYAGLMGNFTPTPVGLTFTAYVAKFANDGADWVGATLISSGITTVSGTGVDFPQIAVDTTGGPNDGNVYLTFHTAGNFVGGFDTGVFTRSTDGGLTFSSPTPIAGAGGPESVTVGTAGNVYVLSIRCTPSVGECPSSSVSAQLLISKSSDGGLTFQVPVIATTIVSLPSPLPGNLFRSGTSPRIAADPSGVYIVTDDFSTGSSNVLFVRSTDGGTTWSSPITVNDVALGQHFFPTITSSGGIISVAWYDSRLGQLSNGAITALDVFYAASRDAGSSFSKSVRVTSASFNPNLVTWLLAGVHIIFIGDYIGIAASPSAVHAIWTDNRNACDTIDPTFGCTDQDVFTATITP